MRSASEDRQTELAWGSVCNLVDKIGDIEENIEGGWDELVEIVSNVITEEGTLNTSSTVFSYVFSFMYNLLFRLKANPTKREFNIISRKQISGKDCYEIANYDYNSFKWAKANGLIYKIDKERLDILINKLTESQKIALGNRC